jgi:hypothetical protein
VTKASQKIVHHVPFQHNLKYPKLTLHQGIIRANPFPFKNKPPSSNAKPFPVGGSEAAPMAENPTTESYAREKLGLGLITLLRLDTPFSFGHKKLQDTQVSAHAKSVVTLIKNRCYAWNPSRTVNSA